MASDADAPEPPKGAPEQPPNPTTEVPKDAPKTVPVAATINRASPAPSMSGSSAPYIPQFTAATQLILKRMKGESSSLSAALSQASKSPSVTASIPSATYDDVKRRLVMSMNTSTQMTVKMPVGNPSAGSSTLSMPTTTVPRSAGTAAALSAIRKVTSGLVGPAAAKSTPSKTQASPRVISSESKVKKTKGTNAGRIHANKRRRAKGQSADNSSVSDQSDTEAATPATTTAGTATPPAAPPSTIMTKSGRQVQKPDSYNPVAMDAATRKRVHYGKRTVEQALCKKCTRMHSPHNNQIVFCDGCNEGWHQLCHEPHIHDNLVSDTAKHWYCADCSAKRERQHAPKKPKVEQPRPKESWAGKSVQQKRAYLSTLSTQELVGLLMTSLELHPDLPIFPGTVVDAGVSAQGAPRSIFAGTTTEGLFPRADANPTGQINYIRKVQGGAGAKSSGGSGKGGKGSAGKAATQQKEQSQDRMNEEDEEFDPLMVLWPKPGMGLYSRLRPDTEDDENLADENDFEAFSVIRYDDRGRKLEENGMKV